MAKTYQQKAQSIASRGLVKLIRAYQIAISPLLAPRCRFYPSCSNYAMEALTMHGPINGSLLSIKRVCKCHPLNPGGIDEVPNIIQK